MGQGRWAANFAHVPRVGLRLVRAIISREALATRFQAGHSRQDWVDTYLTNATQIEAVVQGKIAKACPEPIVVSKYDF